MSMQGGDAAACVKALKDNNVCANAADCDDTAVTVGASHHMVEHHGEHHMVGSTTWWGAPHGEHHMVGLGSITWWGAPHGKHYMVGSTTWWGSGFGRGIDFSRY